jgi:hypothetical protein
MQITNCYVTAVPIITTPQRREYKPAAIRNVFLSDFCLVTLVLFALSLVASIVGRSYLTTALATTYHASNPATSCPPGATCAPSPTSYQCFKGKRRGPCVTTAPSSTTSAVSIPAPSPQVRALSRTSEILLDRQRRRQESTRILASGLPATTSLAHTCPR